MEQTPAIVYVDALDEQSSAIYISPQVEDVLGYSPEEWLSERGLWAKLLHPDDRERVLAEHVRTNLTGDRFRVEYRMIRRNGETVWVHDDAALIRDDAGNPLFWQGVIVDVSHLGKMQELERALKFERDAAERLQAVSALKNTFLQAVSHDMRTPLTSILAAALTLERAGDELDTEERADLLHGIIVGARKLNRLVTDLLDLDRLERGLLEPHRQMTDVTALARRVVDEAEFLNGRVVHVSAEPVQIAVDVAKVERIVENLLVNASKHTEPAADIWIRVEGAPNGVLIAVDDDGTGVPDELKEDIFEAFRQASRAAAGGVGIGLSLVARFAQLHGGRAWVEDRPGGGASFRVFLPGDRLNASTVG